METQHTKIYWMQLIERQFVERNKKTKMWFFKETNRIHKPLAKFRNLK